MHACGPRPLDRDPLLPGLGYLREAIDSVLAQTFDDWELVVVDDRGPEPADEVVAGYADPRISYVRNEQNVGTGRQLERVRPPRPGTLVTLLHNDDRLLPSYVARVVEAAGRHPEVDALFTDARIIGSDGRPDDHLADRVKQALPRRKEDHVLFGDADLAGLLAGNYIVAPTLCLRRRRLGEQPFDACLSFVPDWDFTSRVLLADGTLLASVSPSWSTAGTRRRRPRTSPRTRPASPRRSPSSRTWRPGPRHAASPARPAVARRRVTVRGHLLVRAAGRPGRAGRPREWRALREDLAGATIADDLGRVRLGLDHPDAEQREEQPGHDGLRPEHQPEHRRRHGSRTVLGRSAPKPSSRHPDGDATIKQAERRR